MERIEKTFEINSPVRTVYNQWTQFEDFPRFMDGVEEVRQLDDTHLHWRARIAGKQKEWDSEIVEQVPDQRIAWRATAGVLNSGTVRFQSLAQDRTRVELTMEYEPQGLIEKIADSVGVVSGKVENAVEKFKDLVEKQGESGAWRGEVHGGQKVPPASGAGAQSATTGMGEPGSAAQGPGGTTPMPSTATICSRAAATVSRTAERSSCALAACATASIARYFASPDHPAWFTTSSPGDHR